MKKEYTEIEQLPILLNATEVAKVLRISRANAYVLMHSKAANSIRIGKRILLSKKELVRYIEESINKMQEKDGLRQF